MADSFSEGAMKGFGLMVAYYDRQDRKAERDENKRMEEFG